MLLDDTEISTSDDVQVIVENGKTSLDLFGVDSMLEEHKRRASDAEDGYLSSGSNMSVGRTMGLGRDKLRNHSFMARSGSGSSINQCHCLDQNRHQSRDLNPDADIEREQDREPSCPKRSGSKLAASTRAAYVSLRRLLHASV